ncbi:putative late blight resistance protein homolog R1A-3 [Ipomoea triloba]|uniref:putative late blight resistance protein homolog R1A-3 n=1 Tax=Ipomoea triloba TaxID=35885 RepID=UPI00125DE9A5|nr:putative late blight resistance protein homolog R1A-3 [Ipomoea triloba]
MACVAVISLMRTIELEILRPQPRPILQQKELIPCNKVLIQSLHEKLGFLIELLDENRMDGIQAIKDLETKLRDVAFRVEYEIEFQIAKLYEDEEEEIGIADLFVEAEETLDLGDIEAEDKEFRVADLYVENTQGEKSWPSCKLGRILEKAIEDIDAIKEELAKVKHVIALQRRETTLDAFTERDEEVIMLGNSSEHASHSEEIMVGKNNEFQIVKKMLTEHSSRQREIVSIIGMGGIGKTTLAKRVYEDQSIVSYFDKRAWVVASQHHNKRQMLTGFLKSMGYENSGTEEELAEKLYRYLLHQRYFVVIDDIWSDEAWNVVKACFPDNSNHSRVLLTTRFAKVPTRIGSSNDFSHQMQLLDESESWNLFHEKTCKSYDVEFEAIVRPVVKKLKGLALAIVVVAGLFSKLNTLDAWKNIAETLNSFATTSIDEECSRILSSSYNHLPYKLKACFLYLSIFPEDKEIHVRILKKLWAAEGLIKEFESMSIDAIAEKHIQELKVRNLILVSQASSSCGGKIKAFRIHDLLHSFCVREAKKDNLLHVVYENGCSSPPKDFRWVSIQSNNLSRHTSYSIFRNCRSIFSFSPIGTYLNLKFCSLLRVLYNIEYKIANLVHLRCLFSNGSHKNMLKPFRAWNLQIFSSDRRLGEIGILEFPQLQHFNCYYIAGDFPIFFHQNLKSISWIGPDQCTRELFANIPNVKKRIKYVMNPNNHIGRLENLKKLVVCDFPFGWKAVNSLSKLPKLEVLKLLRCICIDEEEWKLSKNEKFEQLVYLKIDAIYLKCWEASAYHFPNLECLILSCEKLEKIPANFAEISNLKSIKLIGCLTSAVASAKQILEEQHDEGNDDMIVIEKYTIEPYSSDEDGEIEDEEDEDEEIEYEEDEDESDDDESASARLVRSWSPLPLQPPPSLLSPPPPPHSPATTPLHHHHHRQDEKN